jgi:NADPH-dependent 2,4-dienoyl-CoA reductase/sulfur reductase-like enzyme
MANDVVILGFGPAAASAVEALRSQGCDANVDIITAGPDSCESPVLTSYNAAGIVTREQGSIYAPVLDDANARIFSNEEIAFIDTEGQTVKAVSGREWSYSVCLIATGASPVLSGESPLFGCNPLALRTFEDAECLSAVLAARPHADVLISGTSMVALKAAEACVRRDGRPTVLGRSPHILKGSAHPRAASRMETMLEEQGIELLLGETAEKACVLEDGSVTVSFSHQEKPRVFDAVLVAHGMSPNVGFVENTNMHVDRGIVVDAFMRTSAPHVYAAGDVATVPCLLGGSKVAGLWLAARQQGKVAGVNMAKELCGEGRACISDASAFVGGTEYHGFLPANTIKVGDALFAAAGMIPSAEDPFAIEEIEAENEYLLKSYLVVQDGRALLCGFNLVAKAGMAGLFGKLTDSIGRMQAEIARNALQGAFTDV